MWVALKAALLGVPGLGFWSLAGGMRKLNDMPDGPGPDESSTVGEIGSMDLRMRLCRLRD